MKMPNNFLHIYLKNERFYIGFFNNLLRPFFLLSLQHKRKNLLILQLINEFCY